MRVESLFLIAACLLLLGSIALGASSAPRMMNYQGLLLDSNGDPVTSCVSMTFTVYDAASDGNVLWQETHSSVCPDEGLFEVMLGNGDIPVELGEDVFSAPDRWLGVAVNGEAELAPRTQLVTGAYSHRVSTVDGAAAGAIAGPMEIIPDIARRSDGSLIIRGAGSCDAVTINPTLDVALEATNDACEQVLFLGAANSGGVLELHATDAVKALTRMVEIDPAQGLALRATEQGGDETVAIVSQNTGASVYVSSTDAAKALARTVGISPADGNVLISTEANGDQTVAITSNPQGGSVLVTGTDVAKALTRKVEIAPAQNVAMRVTEQNDDDVFLLSSNENGAMLEVNTSDALKAERAVTGTVLIQPANNIALQAKDGSGNVQLEAITDPSGSKLTLYEVAKDGKAATKRLELTKDALFFYDSDGVEEMFKVDNAGNVFSRGNFIGGQPITKDQRASGAWATAFGFANNAGGDSSACSGGFDNEALSKSATVAGGRHNQAGTSAKDRDSGAETIGGGTGNLAIGLSAVIAGGSDNSVDGNYATIGGGLNGIASGLGATVVGGASNTASGTGATVGGYACSASGNYTFVGGGNLSTASAGGAIVVGGNQNEATANAAWSIIGGGTTNIASAGHAVIVGGQNNEASNLYATISGGEYNKARGQYAVVSGGGGSNEADSNLARGHHSVVPGGSGNVADLDYGFAAGRRAKALHTGALVWADNHDADFSSERDNQARFRTDGGFKVDDGSSWIDIRDDGTYLIQTSTGANLTLGGVWSSKSDRNSKENFQPIDKQALLEKLDQLDITEWNYKVEDDGVRHIGPMAQDFYKIFGVGTDDKTISSLDPAGVALVAIQALNEKTKEIDDLKTQLEELKALVNRLLSERQ
jgi:hypothetical protein